MAAPGWDSDPVHKLTEFGPLSSDVKPSGNFFTRMWKRSPDESQSANNLGASVATSSEETSVEGSTHPAQQPDSLPLHKEANGMKDNAPDDDGIQSEESNDSRSRLTMAMTDQKRTLTNVLSRLSSLLDTTTPFKTDNDFKQYWMPDSSCRECYDCGDKFTTFRRRHHCRICGQIFCSKCCNQELPGKIMGYKGGLRVCTYCCKVVLKYARQSDSSNFILQMSKDDLKNISPMEPEASGYQEFSWNPVLKKSFLYEDSESVHSLVDVTPQSMTPFDYTPQLDFSVENMKEERKTLVQDSLQLKEIWKQIQDPVDGVELQSHRIRLRTHQNCIVGKDLVDWLIKNDKITKRVQGEAIGQALMDAGYFEGATGRVLIFQDGLVFYKPGEMAGNIELKREVSESPIKETVEENLEPSWFKEIKPEDKEEYSVSSERKFTDSDRSRAEFMSPFFGQDKSDGNEDAPKPKKFRSHSKAGFKEFSDLEPYPRQDSIHTGMLDDFLTDSIFENKFGLPASGALSCPPGWRNHDHLREENGEKLAFERLCTTHHDHLTLLLHQLLEQEGLSFSWEATILSLAQSIAHFVRPDVRNEGDAMDIRHYVQIKKIPGSSKQHCAIVHGVVCTKNIAHKKMAQTINSPRILLLKGTIEYQRVENKFSSLEPQILQEHEFLRNSVARIASLKPDVVLVEKYVSRLAQQFLLEAGITLVFNIKPAVLERVARLTQGHLAQSIDSLVSRPTLGFCQSFKVKTFQMLHDQTKTLLYFDGCANHLGCTITLRGAPSGELKRVKRVLSFMTYIAYHSQLEISFSMDEIALPPSTSEGQSFRLDSFDASETSLFASQTNSSYDLDKQLSPPDNTDGIPIESESSAKMVGTLSSIRETSESSQTSINSGIQQSNTLMQSHLEICEAALDIVEDIERREPHSFSNKMPAEKDDNASNNSEISKGMDTQAVMLDLPDPSEESERHNNSAILNKEVEESLHLVESNTINKDSGTTDNMTSLKPAKETNSMRKSPEITELTDFSDPLQNYQKSQDESIFKSNVALQEQKITKHRKFKKSLDNVILSVSPLLKFEVPYLVTMDGSKCKLRQYYPEEIYWSVHLSEPQEIRTKPKYTDPEFFQKASHSGVEITPAHPLILKKMIAPITDLPTQALLADFRARGGRIKVPLNSQIFVCNKDVAAKTGIQTDEQRENGTHMGMHWERKIDCLNPYIHQRLSVLFSSFSYESANSPNPCVNPWVVSMDFYGKNDVTLGGFLERFCFRSTYTCPSETCFTPMSSHIRRFVHNDGCIYVLIRQLDSHIPGGQNAMLMWSWCHKCKQVTPVIPMSVDTWSMSFAKYLELRFYGDMYTRRVEAEPCSHSLHHDHYQYFGYKDTVASFKYNTIGLKEIALPPAVVKLERGTLKPIAKIEHIKALMHCGAEVYSAILDHMVKLKVEVQIERQAKIVTEFMTQQQFERAQLRDLAQAIQQKLTIIHDIQEEGNSTEDCMDIWYSALDNIVRLKRLIAEAVATWNSKIQDFISHQKKIEKNKSTSKREKERDVSNNDTVDNISPRYSSSYEESSTFPASRVASISSVKSSSSLTLPETPPNVTESIAGSSESSSRPKLDSILSSFSVDSFTYGISPGILAAIDPESGLINSDKYVVFNQSQAIQVEPSTDANEHPDVFSDHELPPPVDISGTSLPEETKTEEENKDVKTLAKPKPAKETKKDTNKHVPLEDSVDGRTEKKTSMKTIISTFLSGQGSTFIQSPFSYEEHHLMAPCQRVPVIVYDLEPSSIIAYALSCFDYNNQLQDMQSQMATPSTSSRKSRSTEASSSSSVKEEGIDALEAGKKSASGVLSFFRGNTARDHSPIFANRGSHVADSVKYTPRIDWDSLNMSSEESENISVFSESEKLNKAGNPSQTPHIELPEFSDAAGRFYCRVYFAEQFHNLRKHLFPEGEDIYIRSLSRCIYWQAKGGKSGSTFCKTKDDRFILKQMSSMEVESFEKFAPHYFQYITTACVDQKPTALAKILGVYRIGFRNNHTNNALRQDLLVMENLFYNRKLTQTFDLKGSMRNRLVNTSGKREEDLVLLDENLLKLSVDSPLYIRTHSKAVLNEAITNDSHFLSSNLIMDYSLLVGLDDVNKELVVGIIDYIRTFTWDKKLEMVVKSAGMWSGGQGKMPTVVSPELYRTRFLEAMERYFLPVPDRWNGLGCGLKS